MGGEVKWNFTHFFYAFEWHMLHIKENIGMIDYYPLRCDFSGSIGSYSAKLLPIHIQSKEYDMNTCPTNDFSSVTKYLWLVSTLICMLHLLLYTMFPRRSDFVFYFIFRWFSLSSFMTSPSYDIFSSLLHRHISKTLSEENKSVFVYSDISFSFFGCQVAEISHSLDGRKY